MTAIRLDRDRLPREGPLAEIDVRLPPVAELLELPEVLDGPRFPAVAFGENAAIGHLGRGEVVLDRENEPEAELAQEDRDQRQAGDRPDGLKRPEDASNAAEGLRHAVVSACRRPGPGDNVDV